MVRLAVCALLLLSACDDPAATLVVDLRSDLVPGEEFVVIRTTVLGPDGATVATNDTFAPSGSDVLGGLRVLEHPGVANGSHRIQVGLLTGEGVAVAARTSATVVRGDTGITVLVPRDNTLCDPTSCVPGESCLGRTCASEECTEQALESCPPPECAASSDCTARADCSTPECIAGLCFFGTVPGACGAGEWCSPDEGCLPGQPEDDAGTDAGADAAIVEDAGTDAGTDTGCPALQGDCDDDPTNGCETPLAEDLRNCGVCGLRCGSGGATEVGTCSDGLCSLECADGNFDCDGEPSNGCETTRLRDPLHCGRCGSACPASEPVCVAGDCVADPFPSDGSEGEFAPTEDTVIPAGVHHFTRVHVPAGVTIRTGGTGVLELRATEAIVIEGVVDVSGGHGGTGLEFEGSGGGGGTGTTLDGVAGDCPSGGAGGNAGIGRDGAGDCGAGGRSGGGAGGGRPGPTAGAGGGGGGRAGGSGGARASLAGGDGGSEPGRSMGGVGAPSNVGRGGESGRGVYSGGDGGSAVLSLCGGGGGSIGAAAIDDRAMSDTFFPGSGGGGGSGYGDSSASVPGSGGGGGGGALRLSSPVSITLAITGGLFARGGDGGGTTRDSGGGGGGGSGGAIYLAAPSLDLGGEIDVRGGQGGDGFSSADGGDGGLGRIRMSVLTEECSITGLVSPPTASCAPADLEGAPYIATYPD